MAAFGTICVKFMNRFIFCRPNNYILLAGAKKLVVLRVFTTEFFSSIFSFMSLFFFDSPIFIGTICSHESIVISRYILYASHLYAIAILGMFPAYGSNKFYQYFITALVLCCY